VSTWDSIAWFPICVGLTGVGLVLSWLIWRKSGVRRGSRAAAWSLLPLAAYLTGAIVLIGRIGSAVVRFAGSFVFSPKSWAGVCLFGIAALAFLASGGLPMLPWGKRRKAKKAKNGSPAAAPGPPTVPAVAASRKRNAGAEDDDLGDVQEILRRHGIS